MRKSTAKAIDYELPSDDKFEKGVALAGTDITQALSGSGSSWNAVGLTGCRSSLWSQDILFKTKISIDIVRDWLQAIGEMFAVTRPFFMITKKGNLTYYRVSYNIAQAGPSFGQLGAFPTTPSFSNFYTNYERIQKNSKLKPYQILAIISKIPDYSGHFGSDTSRLCIHPSYLNFIRYKDGFLTKGQSCQMNPPTALVANTGLSLRLKAKYDTLKSYDAMYIAFLKNVENTLKTMIVLKKKGYFSNVPAGTQSAIRTRLEQLGLKSWAPYVHLTKENLFYIDYASLGRRINLPFRLADVETNLDKRQQALFNLVREELAELENKNK